MTTASVELWGRRIGAVTWLPERDLAVFEYDPEFAASGIEVSPLVMPLRTALHEFPGLPRVSFKGLPGLLADSLPDKFGNALIDVWLAQQGRGSETFNPVERLCYTGARGMGALEFQPSIRPAASAAERVDLNQLVDLANAVLDDRVALRGKLAGQDDAAAIESILRVGTSAGGARAKAILAWNPETGEFRSGQVKADSGFGYWLMKFDGVHQNSDKEAADPMGFGCIEYAYYLMACDAGINMSRCRLHEEGGRSHFMTQRFDRTETGSKLHYQSLAALMHYDFENAGAHSYEQAVLAIRALGLPAPDLEQQVRRAFFNIVARNQDDHVKNIGFLMNRRGVWQLSPAFDVAYSYNPQGAWTSSHQMSLNGKRKDFTREDLLAFASVAGIKTTRATKLLNEQLDVAGRWRDYAASAGVFKNHIEMIEKTLRVKTLSAKG